MHWWKISVWSSKSLILNYQRIWVCVEENHWDTIIDACLIDHRVVLSFCTIIVASANEKRQMTSIKSLIQMIFRVVVA
jgi:hypothetical protein